MLARFVLFCRQAEPSTDDLQRIRTLPGLTVVEQQLPRLMLVEGDEAELRGLIRELPEWVVSREHFVPRASPSGSDDEQV